MNPKTFKETEAKDLKIEDLKERITYLFDNFNYYPSKSAPADRIEKIGGALILSLNRGQSEFPEGLKGIYKYGPMVGTILEKLYEFGSLHKENLDEFKLWIYEKTKIPYRHQ